MSDYDSFVVRAERIELDGRVRKHAALADPIRLAVADELSASDRTPSDLGRRLDVSSSLLAHHLDVLENAGIVVRVASSGDRRRRYVRLHPDAFVGLAPDHRSRNGTALFVCTRNSARSQLAAALWRDLTGRPATSAGTDPAPAVHPGAVAAARRAGLHLGAARPRMLPRHPRAAIVVTVCDRAHEQMPDEITHMHWSVPDPVADGRAAAFDAAVADLRTRIRTFTGHGTVS